MFLPSTFAHNPCLRRAVPAAPNPWGGRHWCRGGKGEFLPLGPEPGAGHRAVMRMLLPAPTPCSVPGPHIPQPPHPSGDGGAPAPSPSLSQLRLRVVPLQENDALGLSVLRKFLPLCRGGGRGETPAMGLGKSRPCSRPRWLGRGFSLGKPAVPNPSPREGMAPAVGGVCRCSGQSGRERGQPFIPSIVPVPRVAAEQAGTAEGLADIPALSGFVIIKFPAGARRRATGCRRDTGRLRAAGARLRLQSSHSVAANSTKITATKATPSPVCFFWPGFHALPASRGAG